MGEDNSAIELRDIELPMSSVALVLTDRGDGTFSSAIIGDTNSVPSELLALAVGAKRLIFNDQKTVHEAALDAVEETEIEAATDVEWANHTEGSA